MNAYSPWLLNTNAALNEAGRKPVLETTANGYRFIIYDLSDSCWLVAAWSGGSRIAFRLAYSPNDHLVVKVRHSAGTVVLQISSQLGKYEVVVLAPTEDQPVLRYITTLTPVAPLLFPYWPRDIVPLGAAHS